MRAPRTSARDETAAQRADRNLAELLQELRVAGLGVQVLFGFLLSLPFSFRFARLTPSQRHLYLADLLLAALSTALLVAPVAYHRWVFRHHEKSRLVTIANFMALAGLATVGLAISGAVFLVSWVVAKGPAIPVISAATTLVFVGLWFVFPILDRSSIRGAPAAPVDAQDEHGEERSE